MSHDHHGVNKVIEEINMLFSAMLTRTYAPVQYYQKNILHIVKALEENGFMSNELKAAVSKVNISEGRVRDCDSHFPPLEPDMLERLNSWAFNSMNFSEPVLLSMLKYMFEFYNLHTIFNVDNKKLENFLSAVQGHYYSNPYHNFNHAVDVVQCVYFFMRQGLSDLVMEEDYLVLFVASLCHDIEHNGFNNSYHSASESELATRHNDKSPLESHHAYIFSKLMQDTKTNFLENVEPVMRKELRKRIIDCILLTDMAVHGSVHMARLKQLTEENFKFSKDVQEHRTLLTETMVHVCDISNVSRPFNISQQWCENVTLEFFRQGDLEASFGWPVRPNMVREETNCATNMFSFIEVICVEFFGAVSKLFPDIAQYLNECVVNMGIWKELMSSSQHNTTTSSTQSTAEKNNDT